MGFGGMFDAKDLIEERLSNALGIIFDLDGTLIHGVHALPGAVALISTLSCPFVIASNNSSETSGTMANQLRKMGFYLDPDQLILAGEIALGEVARRFDGADVMLIASQELHQKAQALGLRIVAHGGDVVLVCRDDRFDYRVLMAAANSLRNGATLIAANPDLSHPGGSGCLIPETGSLVAAILAVSGTSDAEIIGKPQPLMLREALDQMGVSADTALVIGDNPATDGKGAFEMGIPFLQMGGTASTSVVSPDDLLRVAATLKN